MKRLMRQIGDFNAGVLERWLIEEVKPFLPEDLQDLKSIQSRPEEVASLLERRGIEVICQIVPKDFARQWTLMDKHRNEAVSSIKISIKTFEEVE